MKKYKRFSSVFDTLVVLLSVFTQTVTYFPRIQVKTVDQPVQYSFIRQTLQTGVTRELNSCKITEKCKNERGNVEEVIRNRGN